MEKKSTYGLRLDQMADLFATGAGFSDPAAAKDEDEALRALLREQLTCPAPTGSVLREALVMMLDGSHDLEGRSLGEVLVTRQSGPDLLCAIKDAAKALSCTLESQVETALARTVYFAAIAAALVHHDAKITQNTCATLAESLTVLMAKPWMAPELVELFSRARRICEDRSDEK